MVIIMSTAEAVRSLRASLHMTQVEFARYVGLTVDSISRYERGSNQPVSKVLIRFSKLAAEAGDENLRDLFLAQRRCKLARQVARLRGKQMSAAGMARPVAAGDLQQASDALRFLASETGEHA